METKGNTGTKGKKLIIQATIKGRKSISKVCQILLPAKNYKLSGLKTKLFQKLTSKWDVLDLSSS